MKGIRQKEERLVKIFCDLGKVEDEIKDILHIVTELLGETSAVADFAEYKRSKLRVLKGDRDDE